MSLRYPHVISYSCRYFRQVAVIAKMFDIMEGAQDPHALIGTASCTFTDK